MTGSSFLHRALDQREQKKFRHEPGIDPLVADLAAAGSLKYSDSLFLAERNIALLGLFAASFYCRYLGLDLFQALSNTL